ncbi:resistance to Congo red protein [Nocardioides ungokensis]|nr:resistance to Congo red protein [Nocardioides ungokensis]
MGPVWFWIFIIVLLIALGGSALIARRRGR